MSPHESIAHYKIVSKLGQGGMGAVYRATDTKLNRDVAIKILPPVFAEDAARMQRFEREAQVLASLNHPNIAAIYGIEDGAIVMELVEGVEPKGPLAPESVLPLLQQLIDALEYAHERGIVHRDLKPANIKITPEGTLKLLDFGLAKAIETSPAAAPVADSPTLTIAASLPGLIMGTAGYMSPEQARGGRVDHRTDIWAFGAVLFELLTGKRAFPGDTVSDILAGVLKSDIELAAVPARYRPLVERCLARDLKRRLGWIGDARILLEAPAPPAGSARPASRAAIAAGILFAAAGGLLLSRLLPANAVPGGLPAAKITRVTTDGNSFSPAVSADGKLVAYLAKHAGRQALDLWVQQVTGGSAIRLTDDSGLSGWSNPVFSADSTKIYYFSTREPAGTYEVPVLGGEPRLTIAGATGGVIPSPDGKWLAYYLDGKLMARSAGGGEPRVLLAKAANPAVWSPDSSRVLASLPAANIGFPELVSVPADGSAPTSLPNLYANIVRRGFGDLNLARIRAWLPGNEIVFDARYGDATNLWRIPLAQMGDAMPSVVTLGPWANWMASVRGTHVLFTNMRDSNQVWRLPADLDTGTVTGVPERVTDDLVQAQFPDVRPDDSRLTFISRKSGGQGLFLMDLKTHRERSLYQAEIPSAYSTFSPDGTQIAFGQGSPGWPAFTIPAAGGDAKPAGNAGGRIRGWTRDGRYLLVWRVQNPKPTSIGILDLSTSQSTETMRGDKDLGQPRLSPDNRWIAFQVEAGSRANIWLSPFRGASPVPESEWIAIGPGTTPFWSLDSRSLYFARYPEGSSAASQAMRQKLNEGGHPDGPATDFYRFESTLDNVMVNTPTASRSYLYTLQRTGLSEIWMMELPK